MSEQLCSVCGGRLEAQRVTRLQKYEGHWFIIENVPALVCTQCGEQYFTPDAHDLVVELVSRGQAPQRIESVPVYDASG